MPNVECAICKKRRIYGPENGRCIECSEEHGNMEGAMGPQEYLVERVVSSVSSVTGKERMSAILEYACMLLEAHGMSPPFALKNGRIDSKEVCRALEHLRSLEHVKVEDPAEDHTRIGMKKATPNYKYLKRMDAKSLVELPDNVVFLLAEEHFTVDDSQIDRKMVYLVRALNCHTPRNIRRLIRSRTLPKLKEHVAKNSSIIEKLLSGPRKKSFAWHCPGPRVPSPHQKVWDDTHERRLFWSSRKPEMPPPDPSKTLRSMKGMLEKWPVFAEYDFVKAYEEEIGI